MSKRPGSASNAAGSAPAATKDSARSPITFDDGVTWSTPYRVSSAASDTSGPGDDNQYGDYNGLSGYAGTFFPVWTDRREGTSEQIWTAALRTLQTHGAWSGANPFAPPPGDDVYKELMTYMYWLADGAPTGEEMRGGGMSSGGMSGGRDRDDDQERGGGRSKWDRDDYRNTSFAGSMRDNDRHYGAWRQRQLNDRRVELTDERWDSVIAVNLREDDTLIAAALISCAASGRGCRARHRRTDWCRTRPG